MKDRFQCEVRYLLKIRTESQARASEYLERVERARGKPEADRLRQEARQQWQLGNRGDWDDWRERARKAA